MGDSPRTVFITGAAQGIGRRAAELLLTEGWRVGVYDISDEISWAESNPQAFVGQLDVRDPEQWERALAEFAERAGGIDVLVNNAGILYAGPFEDTDTETDARLIDINVKGVAFGAKLALPYLKETKGQMLNVSSASAIYGTPDMATYSATKFAVRGLTEALDYEWRPHGIRVVSVMPLYVATGMLDGVGTSGTKRMGVNLTADDVATTIVKVIAMGYDKEGKRADAPKPTKVHFPVGRQATLSYMASSFAPPFLTRFVNGKLTTTRDIGI